MSTSVGKPRKRTMNMKTASKSINVAVAIILLQAQRASAVQAHIEVLQTGTNFAYAVFNDEAGGSALYLNAFHLQVRAPFDVLSSPAGWVFQTDHFTYIDWVCTNGTPPFPQDVAP